MNASASNGERDRLHLALGAARMGTWDWDLPSGVISWDRRMHELFGLPPGSFGGGEDDFFNRLHEDDRAKVRRGISRAVKSGAELETGFRAIQADGSIRVLRMRAKIQSGASRLVGIAWDVTPVKDLEDALAVERNLLRSVIDNIPDPIFVKDSAGRYFLDNAAHRKALGRQNEKEVIGKTVFDFFSESSALHFQSLDNKVLETGEPLINHEEEAIRPDGTRRWLSTTKVPLPDKSLIVCINRDITERKIAEEKLNRLTSELRARNQALQEDLEMARELQNALLPQRFPSFPHGAAEQDSAVRFYHYFQPSMTVSGDFFDVLDISDEMAGLFICDVMGHGVRAALVAATVRALVSELRPIWSDPGDFLGQLNRALLATYRNSESTLFASAFYVVADLAHHELRYANAGHPNPLRVTHGAFDAVANSAPLDGNKAGPALGLLADADYQTYRCGLSPRDVLLLFTDGLFEVEGSEGRLYDYHRLSRAVGDRSRLPTRELCHSLIADVRQFSVNRQFNDDVCLVAMDINARRH